MQKPALTEAPLHDLIAQRWSPRAFDGQSLTYTQMNALLEAARWAPSCFNEQPWRYIVALADDAHGFAALHHLLVPSNQQWAGRAGALLLAVARDSFARNGHANAHAWHDVGLANGQLALQAQAMGLAVHQMAGFSGDKARETLAIPQEYSPVAMIAVGTPTEAAVLSAELEARETAPRTRNDLAEMAFTGRFGECFTESSS